MKHAIQYRDYFIAWDDVTGVVSAVSGKETDTGLIDWFNARFAESPVHLAEPSCPPITVKDPAHNKADFLALLVRVCRRWDWMKLPPSLENIEPTASKWKEGPINPRTLPGMVY